MSRRIDLSGQRFGAWLVLDYGGPNAYGQSAWNCRCDCGTIRLVNAQTLRNGLTHSCGCEHDMRVSLGKTKHGQSRNKANGGKETRTYRIWCAMVSRCNGNGEAGKRYYQSRGISVCARWNDYQNFLYDMGEAPEGKSIDRINNDGDYHPDNCRWATAIEQANNKRPRSCARLS